MLLSLRYGLLIGAAAALIYILVAELYAVVINQIVDGAPLWYGEAPIAAVHVFSAMALWFGWLDVIYHGTLRLVATLSGAMPWRYARLLNYAADLLFLRRVGGGFIFIHPLLQEHLAQKPAAAPADNPS